jgi:glycine cleavage system H protein
VNISGGGDMSDYIEITVDKFIFKVATDRFYTQEGLWVKPKNEQVRIGLSDFIQQRNGDVAFAEVKEIGFEVVPGDEFTVIETIKVDISFTSPVSGKIVEVNPELENSPEIINEDPYERGWIAIIQPYDWETQKAALLNPQSYFERMKTEAEGEAKKL